MSLHVVYATDKSNEIVSIWDTAAKATTEAGKNTNWTAVQLDNKPNADVGWYITPGPPTTATATVPDAVQIEADKFAKYALISSLFVQSIYELETKVYYRTQIGGNTDATKLAHPDTWTASLNWLYHEAALAKEIADGTAFAAVSDRDSLFMHIADYLPNKVVTHFNIFSGDQAKRSSWASQSVADGTTIKSDLFTASGATRTPDGTAISITGIVIPAKFTPEHPNLL